MANKLTERDLYNSILNGNVDADVLKAFAEKKLAQLDKRSESAKRRAAVKRAEGDALVEAVFTHVGDEAKTRAQITSELVAEGFDVTDAKVGARLTKLVNDGRIAKAKGRVAGEDGKSKAATLYALAFDAE